MGHTTKSARFTGLLGLLVIVGLTGLVGTGAAVDSMELQATGGSAHDSGLRYAVDTTDRSTATGAALMGPPVSAGIWRHNSIPIIPLGFGRYEIQRELLSVPSVDRFGDWLQTQQTSEAGYSELHRSPGIVNLKPHHDAPQYW